MNRPLFTTEPAPTPVGYVPLARAAICLDCEAVFVIGNTCANCASTQVMPLAAWLFSALKKEEV